MKKALHIIIFILAAAVSAKAQSIKISGRIYIGDSSNHKPKAGVLVRTSSGARTFSNDSGRYSIDMQQTDTLEFYYKGNLSASYPFTFLTSFSHVDIFIDESSGFGNGYHNLGAVRVHTQTSKDSLHDREMYSDVFNYKKQKLSMGNNKLKESTTVMGEKVPLNTMDKKLSLLELGSLDNALSFKKKKQAKLAQKFAIDNEQLNYVQRTFNRSLVAKYSGMQDDDSLDYFIANYAPPYETLKNMSTLELGQYIIDHIKKFRLEGIKNTP